MKLANSCLKINFFFGKGRVNGLNHCNKYRGSSVLFIIMEITVKSGDLNVSRIRYLISTKANLLIANLFYTFGIYIIMTEIIKNISK